MLSGVGLRALGGCRVECLGVWASEFRVWGDEKFAGTKATTVQN